MLRISEVWRIRQIKFQKQSKKCKHFIPFFEILLGSEQLQINKNNKIITNKNNKNKRLLILENVDKAFKTKTFIQKRNN